jgi:hypothetical protein
MRAAAAAASIVLAALVAAGCGGSADDANAGGVPTLGFMTWRDQTGFDDKNFRRCEKAASTIEAAAAAARIRLVGCPVRA